MSVIVTQPFLLFYDRAGLPLEAGYIYIGQPNLNPETSPVPVYWDADALDTAAQPIRTLAGYPSRNGSPSNLYITSEPYSIVIKDKQGRLVYSDLNTLSPAPRPAFRQRIVATNGQTVVTLGATYDPASNDLEIWLNGLLMEAVSDYAETSATSITFTSPLVAGDEITAIIRG